jgi:hypothetical protein
MTSLECPFCRKPAALDELSPGDVVWQFPHSVALLERFSAGCTAVGRAPPA